MSSYSATIYFESGKIHSMCAPRSVDPKSQFVFGRNFWRLVDDMDESSRSLGVCAPSEFVWENPLYAEGELDKLSDEQFTALKQSCQSMAMWVPLERGIDTFAALTSRYQLCDDLGSPTERDYYLAFEIACFCAALEEAAMDGEVGFHIQCY